ncbi:MAG: RCC1-like domain-containing protein, partial [Candidatus Fonsibacter sp.]
MDGRVFAWGYNEYGELGLGTATTNSPYAVWTPTVAPAFYRAQQIASGTFQ